MVDRDRDVATRQEYAAETRSEVTTANNSLRIFQFATAAVGAILFIIGLVAVFGVDFDEWQRNSGSAVGFDFSPAVAIIAIVLGALLLAAALAGQDRTGAAVIAFLILAAGIAGLILSGMDDVDFEIARKTSTLFIVLGAIGFICSLIPWWSGRRYTEVNRVN